MDLLSRRYADPSFLLDGYIQTGRFVEFIEKMADLKAEDDRWEIYLHKVWDQSYQEFCESIENAQKAKNMTKNDVEATVQMSMRILQGFNPDKGEGEV